MRICNHCNEHIEAGYVYDNLFDTQYFCEEHLEEGSKLSQEEISSLLSSLDDDSKDEISAELYYTEFDIE